MVSSAQSIINQHFNAEVTRLGGVRDGPMDQLLDLMNQRLAILELMAWAAVHAPKPWYHRVWDHLTWWT